MWSAKGAAGCVEWAAVSRPVTGETTCGDFYAVTAEAEHTVIVLADGLGHGPEAAQSAHAAVRAVEEASGSPSPGLRLQAAHRALQRLRGAAIGVAVIEHDSATLRWAGVGNVESAILRSERGAGRVRLFVKPGVVGHRIADVREIAQPLCAGDVLVANTDGVDEAFLDTAASMGDLESAAGRGMERFGKSGDDATIVLARFVGAQA